MDKNLKTFLYDILNAIHEIESFFADNPKEFVYYQKDVRTKRAIARNLEIIGEAMNRSIKIAPEIKISDAKKIVDVRNRIIHGYDTVSDEIIWSIVIKYLPKLQQEVEVLLDE